MSIRVNVKGKSILLTGASGGIGRELVRVLIDNGANVLLAGREQAALQRIAARLGVSRDRTLVVACDLTEASDRLRLCEVATGWNGGVDMLINNAGVADFALLADQAPDALDRAIATNLAAPIDLCRQLLPLLVSKPEAHIVNIGSAFGSIGFAGNSVYCATKFGLRGFSEALRRELADTCVRVHYFAPRATRTALNSSAVDELNEELGNAVDDPAVVARQLVRALQRGRLERVLGWPEKFFAKLNAILPRIVDRALLKQLPVLQRHARRSAAAPLPMVPSRIEQRARRVG